MADGMSIRWLDVIAICYIFFQLAYAKAVVEVDLEKFETLPTQCCGGRTWTPFGSNCNGCDPYFVVCLQHIPDGNNKCIQTTQKHNKASLELANGNINPSHMSMDLSDWKGSLLIEVDVKDHNNDTDDVDIDTLSYILKKLTGPESITVALNGTKTRLTISIRIYCQHGYFGPRCAVYCQNGTNYHCSPTGMRVCHTGFAGVNCEQTVPAPPTISTRDAAETTDSSTIINKLSSTTTAQEATTRDILLVETTAERLAGVSKMQKEATRSGQGLNSTPLTEEYQSAMGQAGTRTPPSQRFMTTYRPQNPHKVKIPEPIENFSCNLMIEGHIRGAHEQVVTAISAALRLRLGESPMPSISVSVISSTFVVFDSGKRVTDIAYVVMNNGNVLTRAEVSQTLTTNNGQSALTNELSNKNLKQYSSQPVSTQPLEAPKSWVNIHLPFIIVIACVAGLILLVPLIACAISKRRNARSSFKKTSLKSQNSKKPREKSTKETRLQFDTSFVLDNPMYDLSFDQLQPGLSDV